MNMAILSNRQYEQFSLVSFVMDMSFEEIKRKNLKRILKRYNLNQRQLAKMINTEPGYLNKMINKKRNVSEDIVERICKALQVRPYEFYIESEDELPATDLERKALYTIREAEALGVAHIAEEVCEYTAHRINLIKKQKEDSIVESKTA